MTLVERDLRGALANKCASATYSNIVLGAADPPRSV
jgi:hypothetical protein